MATIASRLTNAGTLLVNGNIDEVTFSNTNPSIYNLATYSQSLTNSVWSSITRASITGSTYLAPDGTYTASKMADTAGNGSGYLRRYYPISSGKTYTYSVYAKAGEWNYCWIVNFTDNAAFAGDYVNFNLATGTLATNSNTGRMLNPTIVSVGNGWYRISVAMTVQTMTVEATGGIIAVGPSIDPYGGTGPGDGTSGIYIWGVQVEPGTTASIYQGLSAAGTLIAPLWYVKNVVNGVYGTGVFDEVTYNTSSGVVKNLLAWSEYYTAWSAGDQSGWFYNTTPNQIVFNAIAGPASGTLAGKLIDMPASMGSQIHRIYNNWSQFVTGTVYTLSIYARAAERTQFIIFHEETAGRVGINVDLSAGTISTYSGTPISSFITSVSNSWYRVGFTFTLHKQGHLYWIYAE